MQLARALRMTVASSPLSLARGEVNSQDQIAFTGAGGKTTAIFQLARELQSSTVNHHSKVIVTATSHLGNWQIPLADFHFITDSAEEIEQVQEGVTLITGLVDGDRTLPINNNTLSWLHEFSKHNNIPLLIEADGSRGRPLKAPGTHEPPIPDFVNTVIVIAGLSGLGKPLTEEFIFRPERFRELCDSARRQDDGKAWQLVNEPADPEFVTAEMLSDVLTHPEGGLKNIPTRARRVALLNQAESLELQSIGGQIACGLLGHFDSVLVGSLHQKEFHTVEKTGGIILAAGGSTRYGEPKQLLDWKGKPFVRHVAETALHAGLWPVIVVTGFRALEVEATLRGLPVDIVHNETWQSGQALSVRKGVLSLPPNMGATIFLLADQPQIPVNIIHALVESHMQGLHAIIAPLVLGEKRANPVLFDRVTFPDLLALTGDVGGRAIFDKFPVEYLPWHDEILLLDVDTPEDYKRINRL